MQQIYRRTPVPKCNLNKVALQLYLNHTSASVFSCKFAAYFQNTFSLEHSWRAASENKTTDHWRMQLSQSLPGFPKSILAEKHKFPDISTCFLAI